MPERVCCCEEGNPAYPVDINPARAVEALNTPANGDLDGLILFFFPSSMSVKSLRILLSNTCFPRNLPLIFEFDKALKLLELARGAVIPGES
jgi:hypothetical protein